MSVTNTSPRAVKPAAGYGTVRNAVRVLSTNPLVRTAHLGKNPSGRWEIRYSIPQGQGLGWRQKTQSTGTTDRTAAERYLDDWLKAAAQVEQENKPAVRRTVAELCAIYMDDVKPVGQGDAMSRMVRVLGGLTVGDLDRNTIKQYRVLRGGRLKDGTIRRELSCLIAALNYCKRHELFDGEVPRIELPPQSEPRLDYLSKAEAQLVWDRAKAWGAGAPMGSWERRVWVFVALAMETAARRGALEDLSWDRVNFELGTIDLYNPRVPRNRKGRPTVPISDALLPVLQEQASLARKDWRTGEPTGRVLGEFGRSAEAFVVFARSLGMEGRLTPHLFRHTWASHAAIAGEPMYHIAKMLGDTIETVTKTYAKLAPSDLRDIANRNSARRR